MSRPIEQPSAPASRETESLRQKAVRAGMSPSYWYPAEWSERVRPGSVTEVIFWGDRLALFRDERGGLGAMENRCAHRHIPLTMGHVHGCNLVCIYHGWSYDRCGRLVKMEHDDFGKKLPKVRLRSYPVKERYGLIWIFPGNPALADSVPLPEIEHAEGADRWASLHFDYTWRAHHSMVIDNLCNLTHLYVHGKWVPYDVTDLPRRSYEGDKITLEWRHTLRRDFMHPVARAVFEGEPGSNVSWSHMIYDYPYQRVVSNDRIKSVNFMRPIGPDRTRVFSIQLWRGPQIFGKRLSAGAMRWITPFIKPITKEIFRQDGATVEAEQIALGEHGEKPFPEPNPAVRDFNALTVRKWEEHLLALAAERRTQPGDEALRVKVL